MALEKLEEAAPLEGGFFVGNLRERFPKKVGQNGWTRYCYIITSTFAVAEPV
ncbi:MAG: hypothetical protein AAGH60_02855 [Pseudomonadota bacterium]